MFAYSGIMELVSKGAWGKMYSYWKRQVLMLDQAQLTKNWPEKLESKINIRYAEKNPNTKDKATQTMKN